MGDSSFLFFPVAGRRLQLLFVFVPVQRVRVFSSVALMVHLTFVDAMSLVVIGCIRRSVYPIMFIETALIVQ